MSPLRDGSPVQDQASIISDIARLTAAHADRSADGGYGKPAGYQHHSRVIRQVSAMLGSSS